MPKPIDVTTWTSLKYVAMEGWLQLDMVLVINSLSHIPLSFSSFGLHHKKRIQDQDPTTEVESSDEGGEYASCDEDQNCRSWSREAVSSC